MLLSKLEICRLLPHAASMCLLETVDAWNADEITCSAVSHRAADNPLRCGPMLPSVCGIEYAAQAIGVHGRLVTGEHAKPAAGYLASLRDVRLHRERLDDAAGPLRIRARLLADTGTSVLCEFDIRANDDALLDGRLMLLLEAGP